MPLALIETRCIHSADMVQALMEAVYLAQREALQVPAHDRQIRYIEHRPEHFACPPGKSEQYTLLTIQLFPGRSLAAKKALYQNVIRRFGELGIPAADIFIVLQEIPLDNWGIRGGQAASEVDLGFTLTV